MEMTYGTVLPQIIWHHIFPANFSVWQLWSKVETHGDFLTLTRLALWYVAICYWQLCCRWVTRLSLCNQGCQNFPVFIQFIERKKIKDINKTNDPYLPKSPTHVFGSIMHHKRLECHTRSNRKYTYAPLDDVGYIVELQLLVHGPRRF